MIYRKLNLSVKFDHIKKIKNKIPFSSITYENNLNAKIKWIWPTQYTFDTKSLSLIKAFLKKKKIGKLHAPSKF